MNESIGQCVVCCVAVYRAVCCVALCAVAKGEVGVNGQFEKNGQRHTATGEKRGKKMSSEKISKSVCGNLSQKEKKKKKKKKEGNLKFLGKTAI